jgi:hypothetical protein
MLRRGLIRIRILTRIKMEKEKSHPDPHLNEHWIRKIASTATTPPLPRSNPAYNKSEFFSIQEGNLRLSFCGVVFKERGVRHVDVEHPDQHRWESVGENSERSDPVSLIPAGQEESSQELTEDDRPALSHPNAAEFFPLLYEDDFNPDEVTEDFSKSK